MSDKSQLSDQVESSTANDIGVVWSPTCKPIVLAIYTVGKERNAKQKNSVVSKTTKIVLDAYAKKDRCFKATNLD